MSRLDQQLDEQLVTQVRSLEADLRELKSSAQYVEAKMYEFSSANAVDLSGSLSSSSGGNQTLLRLTVTATSLDGTSFISGFVPELRIPGTGGIFFDTLATPYQLLFNQAVSSDPSTVVYWLNLAARSAVSASDFRFKARMYATAPVSVSFARLL